MANKTIHKMRVIVCGVVILAVLRNIFEGWPVQAHEAITRLASFVAVSDELGLHHVSHSSSAACLTSQCIDIQAAALARVFPEKTYQSWCTPDGGAGLSGIILVKVPKAASSTSAGVAIRLQRRLNCSKVHWTHGAGYRFSGKNPRFSYTFTTIRDPATRAISMIFFSEVSRWTGKRKPVSEKYLLNRLETSTDFHFGTRSNGQGGFQLRYVAPHEIPPFSMWNHSQKDQVQNHDYLFNLIQQTLEHYDFIIVTERMDESLVAMALRMGVDVGDVLVSASKVAGSNFHFLPRKRGKSKCYKIAPSYVPPLVQDYLQSDEWRAANYGDYLLHRAASASLDKTIEEIGRERFDAAMKRYRRLRAIEEKECAPYVQFPCSNEGIPQPKIAATSCYKKNHDFGCGYQCIDDIIERESKTMSQSQLL